MASSEQSRWTNRANNAEWRPIGLEHISLDAGFNFLGRRASTTDDAVHIPARSTVDLGARWSFKLGKNASQLRLSVTNIGNVYGYDVAGSGAYDTIFGRVVLLSLGIDS